jgi:hypothetical protein
MMNNEINKVLKLKHNIAKNVAENQLLNSLERYLNEVNEILIKSKSDGCYEMKNHSENILNELKALIKNDILYL